jgi:hypothetical protein
MGLVNYYQGQYVLKFGTEVHIGEQRAVQEDLRAL